MQNKRLALNYFLVGVSIIGIASSVILWNNSDKYQKQISRLQGQIDATELAVEIKKQEAERLKYKLDSLKSEALKPDTVEIETIKYYEIKKNEILADSADADFRAVRSFLRSVKLPD